MDTSAESKIKLSVVIPTLNEAANITKTLDQLWNQAEDPEALEFIVVDGQSMDDTQAIVTSYKNDHPSRNVRLLSNPAGRAKQMNYGGQQSQGATLYFIHADTLACQAYDQYILTGLNAHSQAGCFRMRFDQNHWWLNLAAWGTRFNFKVCRGGDQSLFITKDLFDRLGGFNTEYVICEDLEFIDRIYHHTAFCVLPAWVMSSARKYRQRGLWQLQWHFAVIQIKFRLGHTPEQLWQYYQKHIQRKTSKKQ